jgi:hypothetical protein
VATSQNTLAMPLFCLATAAVQHHTLHLNTVERRFTVDRQMLALATARHGTVS